MTAFLCSVWFLIGALASFLVSSAWEHAHGRPCWICRLDARRRGAA